MGDLLMASTCKGLARITARPLAVRIHNIRAHTRADIKFYDAVFDHMY
eukprot:NODE_10155_length_218_cov_287.195266_g9540_i0.p1 GENE.NODE_10155_length_218_cov_287.195266_g9540_i0~~NODE_10155_length_218_cov_287.195266_g9540_i0.p1  ORF type:complete len:56 (-),score=21.73 NODE_10155_length_218_cov_287.195266_g9540_i0:49-192(-)